jgi:hypothetical protein
MKSIGNAVYLLIFISFVRKIFDKVKAPFNFSPHVEHMKPDADEYLIYANNVPIFWTGDPGEADVFFYSACSRCRSLATKLKIVQTDDSIPLCACESTGCSDAEVDALNSTIDELE